MRIQGRVRYRARSRETFYSEAANRPSFRQSITGNVVAIEDPDRCGESAPEITRRKDVVINAGSSGALARFFVNRFDSIIRFLYCRAGLFRLINHIKPRVYHSDFESLNEYFELMLRHLKREGFSVSGKSVLEIGPGNSYVNAYNFLEAGARSVTLVDKYPRYCDSDRQRAYIQSEIDFFRTKRGAGPFEYLDAATCMPNPEYIRFIEGDLREIDLGEGVDFIYSIAVLQHIRDLPQYIRKMSDMLNSGGMVFHAIDLKDKFHFFGNPFLFYKYSDTAWDRLLTEESVTYTNRLRYREYLEMFEECGLEMVWESVLEYDVPRMKLAPRFAGRDDLHIGDAHLLFRKK